ncbi:MAG: outer membrane beta-barrel protein [Opitutaceae bacterium]
MKHILLVGVFIFSAVGARAEFYLGGAATSTASDFETAVDTFESDELGWKAFAGYNFLEFLGAEVGYRDLGSFNEGTTGSSIDLDLKVIDGSVRAYLPLFPILDVFVRAGYANIAWDGSINIEDEIENFDEDDWELFYGVGLELGLGPKLAIRAEWEKYDATDSLDTLSAGVVFRF